MECSRGKATLDPGDNLEVVVENRANPFQLGHVWPIPPHGDRRPFV